MEDNILNKCNSINSINNAPYSNFIASKKRNFLKEYNYGYDIDRKKLKKSLYENFELLKRKTLNVNDICIDHFKDMENYIEDIEELKSIYNYFFNSSNSVLFDNNDLLYVNKKFCSINFHDIFVNKNIFCDYTRACFNNFLNNYDHNDAYNTYNNIQINDKGETIYNGSMHDENDAHRKNILFFQKKMDKNKITSLGKRILNNVSNQLLYIDDLSMYDVLLLLSFVVRLQDEHKKNEKEQKDLEGIANINQLKINFYSLKEIYIYYYKDKTFQCQTCGLRFTTSLDKLNHIENHYKQNYNYISNSDKLNNNKSKKKYIYLDNINLPIEFFVCKYYSYFEDLYNNTITKNSSSFNFNNQFGSTRKIMNTQAPNEIYNYEMLKKDGEFEKCEKEKNILNNSLLNIKHEKYSTENEQINYEEIQNYREELNASLDKLKKKNIAQYLATNIEVDIKKSNENNPNFIIEKNGVENLFDFSSLKNEIDRFLFLKENEKDKNINDKSTKSNNIDNDIKYSDEATKETNFFDFIYGNQNTYDVYLSNYYTLSGDNNVLLNYIDGESMYKNIMKCLEIDDFKLPSWIPQRSIQTFLIKPIEEIYQNEDDMKNNINSMYSTPNMCIDNNNVNISYINHSNNNNIKDNNISFAEKNMNELYINNYTTKEVGIMNDKVGIQNNLWMIFSKSDFHMTMKLAPLNILLSTSQKYKKILASSDYGNDSFDNNCVKDEENHMQIADNIYTEQHLEKSEQIKIKKEIKEEKNETSKIKGEIKKEKKKKSKIDDTHIENSYKEKNKEDSNLINFMSSENFKDEIDDNNALFFSFVNIFSRNNILQINAFNNIFLYYLRDSYFTLFNNLTNDINFIEIKNKLYNYIYNSYAQKAPIFDLNNYHISYCFLCKEKFNYKYSYAYNDYYYTDAISVDLDNSLKKENEQTYNFNFNINNINQDAEKSICHNLSYDILDTNINEMSKFISMIILGNEKSKEKNSIGEHSDEFICDDLKKYHDIMDSSPCLEHIFNMTKIMLDQNFTFNKTVIEPCVNYNYNSKSCNNNNRKKNVFNEYNNLYKNFCIPYETMDILYNLRKENESNKVGYINDPIYFSSLSENVPSININKGNNTNFENNKYDAQKFLDINREYKNEDIENFAKNYENVMENITSYSLETVYKDRKEGTNAFNEIIKCYINDSNHKKNQYNHIYFPSKNYLHTNFTYFHNQCFKNYIEYYISPYFFLSKLDEENLNRVILHAIKKFFNVYKYVYKFESSEKKTNAHFYGYSNINKLKQEKPVHREKLKKKKHF
ncbi:conserved Plasmodium protein, unknown function [Plasmodium berghei]|uniref:Zinc finger protein, putative n=3 Tax=Plasmodium berghei TaxID=5821 RepID=A0A509ARW0_PLABA|nr:zinc finger protein, putative [Plasmodium berghei ANKA]CXI93469.1 conserved Plasmodium protein, unknown function [Plasmodium berghei]SCL96833.1 conserved Plasmodium protein, unknown function [Plasmodium berghei]SCM16498.1 conserved Plasmodium protein, unknown function [Plasmodium berghei]SCM18292.1 conserved Plasmodium protein, unknown function [Plasmodium berghei]SCN27721.1 conserved Plasmodium protein, unknown function [Plasmodium berghei]|eukprot:XP_034423375.1 zinc finger protein, putative [Plasmodium berghei ANKA]